MSKKQQIKQLKSDLKWEQTWNEENYKTTKRLRNLNDVFESLLFSIAILTSGLLIFLKIQKEFKR